MTGCERWALALLAIGTAAFLPLALNRFVFPKLVVVGAGVLLALLVPARGRLPRAAVVIVCLGAVCLLAAALTGAAPGEQLVGGPPRYEGVLVLPVYAGALVSGARLLGIGRARGATSWFLRWLAVAAIAVGLEAVLEAAGLRPLASNVSRPGSLLGNASDEGAWAILALCPLAAVTIRAGGRLYGLGALAAAATLVCSGSRGALLGAVVAAGTLAALTPRRGVRVAIAAGVAVIAVGVFALPATRARVTGASPLATQTATGRELLWRETASLIAAHPLLGVGPSAYVDAIPAYHDRHYELEIGPANPPDSPHDWILQAAAAGGIGLVLLALGLAGLTVLRGVRATRQQAGGGETAAVTGILAGLVGYGVALLFHLTSPGTTPLAALFAGALLAAPAASSPGTGRVRWARVVAPALAGLLVVLAAAAVAEIPLRAAIDDAARGDFAGANADFRLARDLRPWDGDIAAVAAHAYATLAADGIRAAAADGARWITQARAAFPRSTQTLSDAATIDLTRGDPAAAVRILSAALRYDPTNPVLWRELELADRSRGATGQAAAAGRRARQLTR
jgi:O-antigen ligase